jgi:peptide/nickel transport system substrate-binding protein
MDGAFRSGGALWGAALVALVSLGYGGTALAQSRGGGVTIGVEQDIAGFDPLTVGIYDTGQIATAALLFDTLTRIDDNGTVQPRLAVSWSASPDLKKWTLKLRPGVKFQDGSPFDAQAVKFNYDRMMDPDNNCRCAAYLTGIFAVEAIDDLTLLYRLRVPATDLPALLSPPAVTNVFHSPKAIQEMGAEYNRHPVGTGPFRIKSWQSGDRIVLERNPDYWNPGHPYLDEVVIRPLPDPAARFASVVAGDVDIIWHDIADDIVAARKNPTLRVNEYAGSGLTSLVVNTKMAGLDDVRVRQALRYSIDMKGFVDNVADGLWQAAKDPYGPGSFVQCKDTGVLPYDPAKAKELLAAYGKPVSFKLLVTAEPRGMAVGQIFQQFWKEAGVTVTLDAVDQTTFATRELRRDFEVGFWRIADLADPSPQMYANFHTGSAVDIAGYSNPEVDHLLEDARMISDREKRIDDYCAIARILNREVPWIWTVDNHYFSIAKIALEGVHKQYSDTVDVADAWWDKK